MLKTVLKMKWEIFSGRVICILFIEMMITLMKKLIMKKK